MKSAGFNLQKARSPEKNMFPGFLKYWQGASDCKVRMGMDNELQPYKVLMALITVLERNLKFYKF